MRQNYSLSSKELKNFILQQYEHLVELLGYESSDYTPYSGIYQYIQSSGEYLMVSISGVLTHYNTRINDSLKFDYIYRKHFGQIKYKENK